MNIKKELEKAKRMEREVSSYEARLQAYKKDLEQAKKTVRKLVEEERLMYLKNMDNPTISEEEAEYMLPYPEKDWYDLC